MICYYNHKSVVSYLRSQLVLMVLLVLSQKLLFVLLDSISEKIYIRSQPLGATCQRCGKENPKYSCPCFPQSDPPKYIQINWRNYIRRSTTVNLLENRKSMDRSMIQFLCVYVYEKIERALNCTLKSNLAN